MDASTARIGFIGFGNMAQAMAKGLVERAGFDGGHAHLPPAPRTSTS